MEILLEHNQTPGIIYDERLIFGTEGAILNEMLDLNESSDSSVKIVKFKGKFQEADAINKNKRMYPKSILEANVARLMEALTHGGLVGELDHPENSIIHYQTASHKITRLWWEGNVLMGEGVILNTPHGRILRTLINDGVRVGISSRGVGNGKVNEDGVLVIGESYKLITFDSVADPSTFAAFQEKVVGSSRECVSTYSPTNKIVKNESSGIYINKDVLLAFVGGLIQKQVKDKARLS